jgi:D-arabinose 1-dehydrogenase-like Zn-dependent alcohol dehydrogenase
MGVPVARQDTDCETQTQGEGQIVKALALTSFGRLDVQELPVPAPAADEVLIQIVALGICETDIHGYTGKNGRRQLGQIMGHETVGSIYVLGDAPGRHDLHNGDVVTFNPVARPVAADGVDDYTGCEQHDPNK